MIKSKSYISLYTATVPDAVSFKVTPTIKWNKVEGATGYTVYKAVKCR